MSDIQQPTIEQVQQAEAQAQVQAEAVQQQQTAAAAAQGQSATEQAPRGTEPVPDSQLNPAFDKVSRLPLLVSHSYSRPSVVRVVQGYS